MAQVSKGTEIQLSAATVHEGREWTEATLEDGSVGYVLGPSARSHTTLGGARLTLNPSTNVASATATHPAPAPADMWMGEQVFHPRKEKQLLHLLLCLAGLVANFIFLANPKGVGGQLLFWGVTIALSLTGLLSLALLFPNAASMRVDKEGITLHRLWRATFYRWKEIEHFAPTEMNTGSHVVPVVAFKLSASARVTPQTLAQAIDKTSLPDGFDVVLPEDLDFGVGREDLARQLNELRQRYAATSGTTPVA